VFFAIIIHDKLLFGRRFEGSLSDVTLIVI